ncbi:MAG: VCBS repeat-containing protein, partial [Bacteroidales bacterium]|nr:VCBS repeat-containing protein [Bacteroidales bacterium]
HTLDYKNAKTVQESELPVNTIFTDITSKSKIDYLHKENEFDDFKHESLLPHKMSQFGPALASADVNGDGLEDFYVGGALGFAGVLYVQNQGGAFQSSYATSFLWDSEKKYEDVAALFFDADSDGDQDLYVVSGGNEYPDGDEGLQDRLYTNDGKGNFLRSKALPELRLSGSAVKSGDYDGDGDLDLIIGGRQTPGLYPYPASSTILRNDSKNGDLKFVDVTAELIPEFKNIGMVTDADWVDIDNDNDLDLAVVGEWMPITIFENDQGAFKIKNGTGLEDQVGWWSSIEYADFDNDGDMDFIAGNLGLNYKYKASPDEPFEIYAKDFDNNGTTDIVLGYYDTGNLVPVRGLECISNQIPSVLKKFPTNNLFAKATLKDIFGEENLQDALFYAATDFATCYIENTGDFTFKVHPLVNRAQLSSVNTIQIDDFNSDTFLDVLIAGNMYGSEIRTPRNDAGYGLLLTGDGKGNFIPVEMNESGVCVPGDVKGSKRIKLSGGKEGILFAKNQDYLQLLVVE